MKTDAGWSNAVNAIEENDPHTRGIVVLGLDAPQEELAASFKSAAKFDLVKGFAVGRTIFGEVARQWMTDKIDDEKAVAEMAQRYSQLCEIWDTSSAEAKWPANKG